METYKELGIRIKERRKELQMSLQDVADLCNTTRQTINNWENGKVSKIPVQQMELLANALQVKPTWLIYGSGGKFAPRIVLDDLDKEIYGLLQKLNFSEKLQCYEIIKKYVTEKENNS